MKKAYATILSTEDFFPGVRALYLSLRRFSTADFLVFVTTNLADDFVSELEKLGMIVIREKEPVFDSDLLSEKQLADRWNKTLFKLVVFKEHGYDKLIYLDGDMLVRDSLDELFDKPAFSAVADRDFFPAHSRGGLNAGTMVISPSDELYESLLATVTAVAGEQEVFGDQDVINKYLSEWDHDDELHLDCSYNTCFYESEKIKNPKVVHFILADKPWMWSGLAATAKTIKWKLKGRKRQVQYYREYKQFLRG